MMDRQKQRKKNERTNKQTWQLENNKQIFNQCQPKIPVCVCVLFGQYH